MSSASASFRRVHAGVQQQEARSKAQQQHQQHVSEVKSVMESRFTEDAKDRIVDMLETEAKIQVLAGRVHHLENIIYYPRGLQEQLLVLQKEVERMKQPLPAVSQATRDLRTAAVIATATSPSPSGDTAEPK